MSSSQPSSNSNTASVSQAVTSQTVMPQTGSKLRNGLIAVVAIVLSVALFWGINHPSGTNTLAALAKSATPLAMAQQNGKPTLMEFYADWCTTCQAMAGDLGELKQEYGDRLNFVMLNVDNTKWLPELTEYRVDGIPHFVFIDDEGTALANVIGEQPRAIMATNLDALIQGQPLPNVGSQGETSSLETATTPAMADDPRSHGG
ncbi:MAG: thioredoxin family protein [Cyanobacteria bacterium P01_F01_bin.150]